MMKKEKVKVYIYTRVSTAMQIDGYSLDAQKSRMKAYAEFNDYEIVGEYEDAGKSGKSIEVKTACPMYWCSSSRVSAETRQMSYLLYRSCRISVLT